MLGNHGENSRLKLLQRADGLLLVVAHQPAVAGNVGCKNSGQASIHRCAYL